MLHLGKTKRNVLKRNLLSFFSNGDLQAQCQCKSGMNWNGQAVSIEILNININD
jgi:hypothetical protein